MQKTIWKYALNGTRETFEIPEIYTPVRVGMQRDHICVWCIVDPNTRLVPRTFYFTGTGQTLPAKDKYVGSVSYGPYEWHVWEVP